MKKFLLFILLIFYTANLYSVEYKYVYQWNTANWNIADTNNKFWEDKKKNYSKYDFDELLRNDYLEVKDDDGNWNPYLDFYYEYNSDKLATENRRYNYINNAWIENYRKNTEYVKINDKSYVSQIEEFTAASEGVKPFQKRTYIYDSNGRLDTMFLFNYLSEDYKMVSMYHYKYNEKGKIDELNDHQVFGDDFVPVRYVKYLYNEKDLLINQTDYIVISETSKQPVERMLYEYDENDRRNKIFEQHYAGDDEFRNFKKTELIYYPNGKVSTESHFNYDPEDYSNWLPGSQFVMEYDEEWNNNITYYNTYRNGTYEPDAKYFLVSILDVKEYFAENKLYAFPNPSTDVIQIPLMNYSSAQIIDYKGNIVVDNIKELNKIDINNLSTGAYFIKVLINSRYEVIPFVKAD